MKLKTIILSLTALCALSAAAQSQDLQIPDLQKEYPRMTDRETAAEHKSLAKAHAKVDRYVEQHIDDPEWIVSRLQMHWKSHASVIYIKGEQLDHMEGRAPVPTVRYPSNRSGHSPYARPALEDIKPYQDSLGLWLKNRVTGEMQWVDPREAGGNAGGINITIINFTFIKNILYLIGKYRYICKVG